MTVPFWSGGGINVVAEGTKMPPCPITGHQFTVTDGIAVIDKETGHAWMTQRQYDRLQAFLAPASADAPEVAA